MADKKTTNNFTAFMKKNKKVKENVKYKVTKSLVDETGEALEWEFKHLTTAENNDIMEACSFDVPIHGKTGAYRSKFNNTKYVAKLIASSVVFPNLNDKELQDDYGVMSAEELLKAMVDDLGEYNALTQFVTDLNGFSSMEERVEEVKN